MRKIILLVILVVAIGAVLVLLRGSEDDWICQNGQWVKHGNPSKPMPTTLCEGQEEGRESVTELFVYFSNNNLDPEISCNKTFAVARLVPRTQSVLKAAIEELLKGPAPAEAKLGFGTLINPGVTINSVNISGNTATIDFSPKLDENMGGSCRVAAIRSQITNTAKQFANIKNVIISINGESELILQP